MAEMTLGQAWPVDHGLLFIFRRIRPVLGAHRCDTTRRNARPPTPAAVFLEPKVLYPFGSFGLGCTGSRIVVMYAVNTSGRGQAKDD